MGLDTTFPWGSLNHVSLQSPDLLGLHTGYEFRHDINLIGVGLIIDLKKASKVSNSNGKFHNAPKYVLDHIIC